MTGWQRVKRRKRHILTFKSWQARYHPATCMRHKMNYFISAGAVLLLVLPGVPKPVYAIPTITCHCFTDRSYDPARPALADPYFLATTQNTFFAIVFTVDKKSIVIKKQQGVSGDDLWVAFWLAAKTGLTGEELLKIKPDKETWRAVLTNHHIAIKGSGALFAEALHADAPASRLSQLVVDDLFRRYRLLSEQELTATRKAGAANQELILATLIAARSGRSVRQVYQDVKTGGNTWGALLQHAKIDTRNIQHELVATLKLPSK